MSFQGTNLAGTEPWRKGVFCGIPGLVSRYLLRTKSPDTVLMVTLHHIQSNQFQSICPHILSPSEHVTSIIGPVIGRLDNPLEFLGLYKTHNEASGRHQIPARLTSGDTTESQILQAGQRYLHRSAVIESVFNDLVKLLRYENCKDLRGALDILLLGMESHLHEKHIQISGSAGLYYIVKSDQLKQLSGREWNVKVSPGKYIKHLIRIV